MTYPLRVVSTITRRISRDHGRSPLRARALLAELEFQPDVKGEIGDDQLGVVVSGSSGPVSILRRRPTFFERSAAGRPTRASEDQSQAPHTMAPIRPWSEMNRSVSRISGERHSGHAFRRFIVPEVSATGTPHLRFRETLEGPACLGSAWTGRRRLRLDCFGPAQTGPLGPAGWPSG